MPLAVSTQAADPADAVLRIAERLAAERGRPPSRRPPGDGDDAALVFASAQLAADPVALSEALSDVLGATPWIGFVGNSAFHGARLEESMPGLSLLWLDGAGAFARHVQPFDLGSHVAAALVADAPPGRARFLAAPAAPFDAENLLPSLDEQGVPIAGALCARGVGMEPTALAPGLTGPGGTALLSLDGYDLLLGVAQGTKSIGAVHEITVADGSIVRELDGRPALEVLLGDLPADRRGSLADLKGALFAGLATADGAAFVMRQVLGVDPRIGALAIAGRAVRGGELLFGLLDGQAARDDLEATLSSLKESLDGQRPEAIVVFDCAGRSGLDLGVPLYDVERTEHLLGGDDIPVVGVACAGELATVGAATHHFTFTAAIAVLLRSS